MKKRTLSFIFLFLCAIFFINIRCTKNDEQPQPPAPAVKLAQVKGKITNEYSQLLTNATLTLLQSGTSKSLTSTNGNYVFDSLQAGSYSLGVKRNGYIETSASISIAAGDSIVKDFILKSGTTYFNLLSDSIINAKPYAANYSIKVASNTAWVINNASNWIVPDKPGTSGDDSIVLKIAANAGDSTRQGLLVVQAGSITRNILIKQLPDVKLLQTIPLPGNAIQNIKDSIALVFNQPVSIKAIFPGLSTCMSDIRFSYTGNRVAFSYACAALGGDYPFTITTNNSLGDQYNFTFNAGFYQKAINLTGTIQSYFVNDADNSYWIITDHPNALYKIDMTTFSILNTYNLPNEPVLFTISPYNNKIYVAYRSIPKLYIMNQSGSIDQVIDIPHDTTRGFYEYNGPIIYPSMLTFTKSGKGIIWLKDAYGSGYANFWFIDAANNHRIWYQSVSSNNSNYYIAGKTNYDQSKLVLTRINNDPTITIFDPQQMNFSNWKPSKISSGLFLAPNRINDNIFTGQSIVNLALGFETSTINTGGSSYSTADFSYKPGKDLTLYLSENGFIETLDYQALKIPVKYDAINYLTGLTTTTDGKYIIATRHDGNYNAKIIQLSTTWFDQ